MQKKITLVTTAFVLVALSYLLFSQNDRAVLDEKKEKAAAEQMHQFVSESGSKGSKTLQGGQFTLSGGKETRIRVHDEVTGRAKYEFQAKKWEPGARDTDFLVEDLLLKIFMPRGEITYISAENADVSGSRKGGNQFEARSGTLTGKVTVVIDRTTEEWRLANPDRAERDAHPEELVTINMETAKFDMDQAELISDGAVRVESREAVIEEVSGLTVQWDEVDNRIEVLRFNNGGRMTLRGIAGMMEIALPGGDRKKSADAGMRLAARGPGVGIPRAQANMPQSISTVSAEQAATEIRHEVGRLKANQPMSIEDMPATPVARPTDVTVTDRSAALKEREELVAEMTAIREETQTGIVDWVEDDQGNKPRIHSYRVVFNNEVVAERFEAGNKTGRLTADELEVHFDFGRKQRNMMGPDSRVRPNQPSGINQPVSEPEEPAVVAEPDPTVSGEDEEAELVLTWNGPMQLRPFSPPNPTGKRFDVIATGKAVKVESEQGNATCGKLVYRNERRQVWLSADKSESVELSVDASRKIVGRDVFFDQKRGIGRIDGKGFLQDLGMADATTGQNGKPDSDSRRDPVMMQWSKGVDVELGTRLVRRTHPDTGYVQEREKEYLRRAWFHGDVKFEQGDETLTAKEVAATFGLPESDEDVADYLSHLNLAGQVRLARKNDVIRGEKIDVELIRTADGRNIPKIVDATGDVLARQEQREIHTDHMHVVLGQFPGEARTAPDGRQLPPRPRIGIETLDATGQVLVRDPARNLKISRANTLKAVLKNGNELVSAVIVSPRPAILARARFEDMAVHGHRIQIDMKDQSIAVPGPGKAWMVTRGDFGGRRLNKPTPVKTVWSDRMNIRMSQNFGVFVGNVRSKSDGSSLKSDKLTVRFAKMPPVRQKKGEDFLDRFGFLGAIVEDKAELRASEPVAISTERKRPVYIMAEGNAEAMSSTYEQLAMGKRGRLLSRGHVAGRQIAVDLTREQMMVPCAGTLLIEDYQLEKGGPTSARIGSPLMSSVRGDGPSQTLLAWEKSMDFFVDRGLVAFERGVNMVHRSGRQMVLKEDLAESMNLSVDQLRHLSTGRKATLSCGHLLLEFVSGTKARGADGSLVRATDLKRLIAKNSVHLQEGTRSLLGASLEYFEETSEVCVKGHNGGDARMVDQDESSQHFREWRGPLLIWNRDTNEITAPGADIRTSSR